MSHQGTRMALWSVEEEKKGVDKEKTEGDVMVTKDECAWKYEEEGENGRGMGGEVETEE